MIGEAAFTRIRKTRTILQNGKIHTNMAIVDEDIAREYFELNGLFALQECKYQVQSRKKRADEEIDMYLVNPQAKEASDRAESFMLSERKDFDSIKYAAVSIKPWHTSLFTPAMLKKSGQTFSFLKRQTQKKAREMFGLSDDSKEKVCFIVVISGFAAAPGLKREAIEMLKSAGVGAALTYPEMLAKLVSAAEPNNNYAKSQLMQTLRILKNYGMIRPAQLELFKQKK